MKIPPYANRKLLKREKGKRRSTKKKSRLDEARKSDYATPS